MYKCSFNQTFFYLRYFLWRDKLQLHLEIYPHGRSFQQQQENKCTYVRQTKPAY